MNKSILEELKPKKIASQNGIEVYKIGSSKFKTNLINIFFHDELNKENAAKNALLPAVLRRGTKKLPSTKDLSIHLEELYGAIFDCGINKKGEMQFLHFYMECISDEYADGNDSVFEKAFDYVYDIMFEPKLENEVFKKEFVEQEKTNIKKLIESRINDKRSYAVDKCLEEMCEDEKYGVYEFGKIEDYDLIDEKNLYKYYTSFIKRTPISVYISGDVDEKEIEKATKRLFELKRVELTKFEKPIIDIEVKKIKEITDKMAISQGKLSMGYRTYVSPGTEEYYSLLVCNSVLGGGIHSKLFQNVREKESLAYYAFSRLEKYKGLMVLSSGIEIENKQKVIDIMEAQIEDIRNGDISDYEYDVSQKVIESSINSLKDSQIQMVDFHLAQSILGTSESLESIIEKCKKVTREDIKNVAKKLKLDTVYFLTKS